jgi:predicted P-loop ATPase/GTPase
LKAINLLVIDDKKLVGCKFSSKNTKTIPGINDFVKISVRLSKKNLMFKSPLNSFANPVRITIKKYIIIVGIKNKKKNFLKKILNFLSFIEKIKSETNVGITT